MVPHGETQIKKFPEFREKRISSCKNEHFTHVIGQNDIKNTLAPSITLDCDYRRLGKFSEVTGVQKKIGLSGFQDVLIAFP